MAIKLQQFLDELGFHANPFATTNAEQEADLLPSFFVPAEWFDQLLGDPRSPQSLILFAPQGHGKTSHRIELGRRASEHPQTPALVVTLNDLSLLLRVGLDRITIDSYIDVTRRLCLEQLDMQLQGSSERLERMKQSEAQWTLFRALLHQYAPLRVIGQSIPAEVLQYIDAFRQTNPGPKEWLNELSGLARTAGFCSVYVLIDGIDELRETKSDSEAMFRLISPLLDAPGFLQECGFAFKFFLPQNIESSMRTQKVGRLDRIPSFPLTWSSAHLHDMLSKRLERYSLTNATTAGGMISRFKDLCAVDFDVDLQLVESANTSPRRMIDLAMQILEEHCARVTDPKTRIGAETIEAVLGRHFVDTTFVISQAPSETVVPILPLLNDPLAPQLFVDNRGDVWLGQTRLTDPLAPLLRKCIEYLWTHRHRQVSYSDLQRELYGDAYEEQRGDPKSSLGKLIGRLREYLEPGKPSSHQYIDVQAGSGYVLRNFREDQG